MLLAAAGAPLPFSAYPRRCSAVSTVFHALHGSGFSIGYRLMASKPFRGGNSPKISPSCGLACAVRPYPFSFVPNVYTTSPVDSKNLCFRSQPSSLTARVMGCSLFSQAISSPTLASSRLVQSMCTLRQYSWMSTGSSLSLILKCTSGLAASVLYLPWASPFVFWAHLRMPAKAPVSTDSSASALYCDISPYMPSRVSREILDLFASSPLLRHTHCLSAVHCPLFSIRLLIWTTFWISLLVHSVLTSVFGPPVLAISRGFTSLIFAAISRDPVKCIGLRGQACMTRRCSSMEQLR
mmetsp:Transcript_77244/g.218440  ORF Transcript_77244/g.218440 Transcript_77244/m.218440 type:complete len:295 (-) Transcript_77244:209-1093(-)